MTTCPNSEQLERFLDNTLSEAERVAIETHVESCTDCLDQLERLTASAGEAVLLLPDASVFRADDAAGPAELPAVPGYEVLEAVGAGGMGVVYKARDLTLGRTVALKLLAGPVARPGAARRFHREAEVLAQLAHENIVTLYEARLLAGRPYFAMQFVRGGSLAEQLPRFRRDPRAAAALIEQVARAVHHAHANGVLHRDLKPANILLDEAGKPWVSDFGLAKLLTAPGADSDPAGESPAPAAGNGVVTAESLVTQPGGLPGTPAYMAPEQLAGAGDPASPAPDVWALGVVLYELLTGQRPFTGQTREELREQIRHGLPTPPRQLAPGLDRRLERVVLRCLEKEPGRRYPSAATLADALAAYRTRRPLWRRVALAGAAAAALAFAGFVALAGRDARPEDPYQQFLRATAPLVQRLERGEAVDLVVPGRRPPYFLRSGEGAVKVRLAAEGLNIFSPTFGLVEFLPSVPLRRYRIVAELRHDLNDHPKLGMMGLYCRGSHVTTDVAENHLTQFLWLDDYNPVPVPTEDGAMKEVYRTTFEFVAFSLLNEAQRDNLPYRAKFYNGDNAKSNFQYPPLPPQLPRPWRTVRIDVDERQTVATWRDFLGDGRDVPLGPLTAAQYQEFLTLLRTAPAKGMGLPDLRGVPDQQFEPQTVGACVTCGRCVVRRFRIEPLPLPGP